ncbi:MAG: UDP-N-acetylmuramate--L-alanine ligase [Planctomycetota bacterium]
MIAPRGLDLSEPRLLHLLGIGGTGMGSLARLLRDAGHTVTGADLRESEGTASLRFDGFLISTGDESDVIPTGTEAVIHSAALPRRSPALRLARSLELPVLKYAQALARFGATRRMCAVAGTHGKTTTTALLAYALREAGADPSFVLGGVAPQLGGGAGLGRGDLFVAEACEYDRSFLHFQPEAAIVTNVEADHLDYYRDLVEIVAAFRSFVTLVGDLLVLHDSLYETLGRAGGVRARVRTYGFSHGAQVRLEPLGRKDGLTEFRALNRKFRLRLPGRHNLLNAGAVVTLAHELGADMDAIGDALEEFSGVGRRLQVVGRARGVAVIDDYAHHPTEVAAGLQALREEYSPRRLWCVFQPHQYSRTKRFLSEFAHVLRGADRVVIPDIFAARDGDTASWRVSSSDLVREVCSLGGDAVHIPDFSSIVDFMSAQVRAGDVVVTMGAGDIGDVAGRLAQAL